jgi:tRNA G18 (ribose-2'-O)-methylase SpoU
VTDPPPGFQVVPISSPDDPRLRDYVGLTDVALRRRREPEMGLFVAEGELVIRRAVTAGYAMRSMVLSPKWLALMEPVARQAGAPILLLEESALEQVTGFHVHRGALAAMNRRPLQAVEDVLASAERVALLEDVNTHTNVGSLFRAAAGLGVDGVLISPRCADPLYRRSIRVSMGAVFQVPWTRLESWPVDLNVLKRAGFVIAALALRVDAVGIDAFVHDLPDKLALMLGSEGDGLSDRSIAAADVVLTIPMSGGVDSLNVAAAAAVAFWATRRGRRRDG